MKYAVEWIKLMETGQISAREIATAYIHRIEEINLHINAVVELDRVRILKEADIADEARREGKRLPLLGVPVSIKDSLNVAGVVSTGGSYALEGNRPSDDATVVRRLREAGAVILCKTNCPEHNASYETDNAIFGRTNNPFDVARTSGGSSGGEGALVGAGGSPVGIGSDGGGSIRVPAHYCGVVGLRPTSGRVPGTGGVWPSSRSSGYMDFAVVGPFGRCVADVALALGIISGPDDGDPITVPVTLGSYSDVRVKELKIGYFIDVRGAKVTAGTRKSVETAVQALCDEGLQVKEVQMPTQELSASELFFRSVLADGGAQFRADLVKARGRHTSAFEKYIKGHEKYALSAADWFDIQRQIFAFRQEIRKLFREFDIILSPVAAGPAPLHGEAPGGHGRNDDSEESAAFEYVSLFSIAALPAASVPVGLEGGLPIGVQVVGAPFREDKVLAVAALIEERMEPFSIPDVTGPI